VTGGGIRRGIAAGLARAGASVMIGEIIPERAKGAADAIKGQGTRDASRHARDGC